MTIRAGRQDERIVIERAQFIRDAIGHTVPLWSTYVIVWAEIIPVSGAEVFQSARDAASEIVRVIIRYINITERDRISYDSAYWDITNIKEIGRRQGMELLASRAE